MHVWGWGHSAHMAPIMQARNKSFIIFFWDTKIYIPPGFAIQTKFSCSEGGWKVPYKKLLRNVARISSILTDAKPALLSIPSGRTVKNSQLRPSLSMGELAADCCKLLAIQGHDKAAVFHLLHSPPHLSLPSHLCLPSEGQKGQEVALAKIVNANYS